MRKRIKWSMLLVAMILTGAVIWYAASYYRLQSLILPIDSAYTIAYDIPNYAKEEIAANRAPLLKLDTEKLEAAIARISGTEYSPQQDQRIAAMAYDYQENPVSLTGYLTMEQATEEVEYLHSLLKHALAGYQYFGGDSTFDPIFDEIKTNLNDIHTSEGINRTEYIPYLQEALMPAIVDRHSTLDGFHFGSLRADMQRLDVYNDSLMFVKIDGHYYLQEDDDLYLVESIDDDLPGSSLRLGIFADGTIGYMLFQQREVGKDKSNEIVASILVRDGNELRERELLLHMVEAETKRGAVYTMEARDHYIYMSNTSLASSHDEALNQMIKEASSLRQDKPVVLDLRNHGGGYSEYAMEWTMNYLGVPRIQLLNVPIPMLQYEVSTMTVDTLRAGILDTTRREVGLLPICSTPHPLHIKNDTPLIVLTNRGTGSSGEWFVSYLRRMDNVIIVGENTGGFTIGGSAIYTTLPYSRARLGLSTGIWMDSDLEDCETTGFSVDLFTPPQEAEERTAAMISTYF